MPGRSRLTRAKFQAFRQQAVAPVCAVALVVPVPKLRRVVGLYPFVAQSVELDLRHRHAGSRLLCLMERHLVVQPTVVLHQPSVPSTDPALASSLPIVDQFRPALPVALAAVAALAVGVVFALVESRPTPKQAVETLKVLLLRHPLLQPHPRLHPRQLR